MRPALELEPDRVQRQEGQPHVGHHRLLDRLVARSSPSITGGRSACSRKNCSIAARVPEPSSRTRNPSSASAAGGIDSAVEPAGAPARDHDAAGARRTARRACRARAAAVPMIARSTSLPWSCRDQRLAVADRSSRSSIPGCSARKRASSRGTKYLAVLTMPIVSGPLCKPLSRATASSASLQRREHPPGVDQQVLAGRGQRDRCARPRSNSGKPTSALQLLHLHRDRRRGQVQLLGRAGEAQVPGDGRRRPAADACVTPFISFSYL